MWMLNCNVVCASAVFWVIVVFSGDSQNMVFAGSQKDESDNEAKLAKKAAEFVINSARKRDVKAFNSGLGAHTKMEYEAFQALDDLYLSVQKQFKKPGPGGTLMKDVLEKFCRRDESLNVREVLPYSKRTKIVVIWKKRKGEDGKEAISELHWRAINERGLWKIVLPGKGRSQTVTRKDPQGADVTVTLELGGHLDGDKSIAVQRRMRKELDTLKEMAVRVENGEFKSLDEFNAAYVKMKK